MGALLESGMVGNIGLKHLRVIKEDTIKKWDNLGFLEGLDGHQKDNIAQLYENQASYLINEAAVSDASGSFETVVFPIIRRVFSKLLANDIVSVQAMNLPIGKLFYFVPKIQDRNSGAHYAPFGYPNTTDSVTAGYGADARNLYDRFYEEGDDASEGLFDYSKGAFTTASLTGTSLHSFSAGAEGSAVVYATGDTLSSVILKVTGFTKAGQGKIVGANGNEMDTEEFLASLQVSSAQVQSGASLPFNIVTQKYGKGIVEYGQKSGSGLSKYNDICDEEGAIYLNVDLQTYSSTSGFSNHTVAGSTLIGTDFVLTYRQYATLEFEEEIGEVSFDLSSVTVSVTERKLRASWSPGATLVGYTQKDWNQTLITKINQVSAQIHKTTLRGGANWIVVSSEVSAVFDDLEYFHVSNAGPEQDQYNMGIEKIGTLAGRYQVFRDPYFPAGKVLIGHKGKSLLDAGYIYAPYVPLQLTPTMYNPFNMTPIKGIMTRYAKKMVNNRYFGIIDVKGLATFSLDTLR